MVETEDLCHRGESAADRAAFARYRLDAARGKNLLQLEAVAAQMTPWIRAAWSPRSFTAVSTSNGFYDAVECNIAYHFHRHVNVCGMKHRSIGEMTRAALTHFHDHKSKGCLRKDGLLQLPDGSLYEPCGKIVTYVS